MIVDKAPQPHYFKGGWIEFHKNRNTEQLFFAMNVWNDVGVISALSTIKLAPVKDEAHLKELLSIDEVSH